MRITLTNIKELLSNNIIDSNCRHFFANGTISQQSFIMAFFPIEFITKTENKFICEVRSNKSSRLSNIFNRIDDPKRIEKKFRKRFIQSFDVPFYDEMVDNCRFFLRNHNSEMFCSQFSNLIKHDSDINTTNNHFIYNYIESNLQNSPEKSLALIILWAFHIGEFNIIIDTIKKHESNFHALTLTSKKEEWYELLNFLESTNIEPKHIQEFMELAFIYGISGPLGAIMLRSKIRNSIDINPLIHFEVGDMLSYGNNYLTTDHEQSLTYYTSAANSGYGQALWTMGQMSQYSRYNSNLNNINMSLEYYKLANEHDFPLSNNNLGIFYIRGWTHYINEIIGFNDYIDCFEAMYINHKSDIYDSIKSDAFFLELLKHTEMDKYIDYNPSFIALEELHNVINKGEDFIINHFFAPTYTDKDYLFAIGSNIEILEARYNRLKDFYEQFKHQDEFKKIGKNLLSQLYKLSKYYSTFFCTESHYTYARILETYFEYNLQEVYEHYYIAAYETPHETYRFHSLVRFLELHYHHSVFHKKENIFDVERLLDIISKNLNNYDATTCLVLRSLDLLLNTYNINIIDYIKPCNIDTLKNNLIVEMNNSGKNSSMYNEINQQLVLALSEKPS